ncbi:MAG: hypothetical protein RO009_23190 [Pseudorhodoplanes sp.]|jgi:hypothetical protein|nr:hypothetical protein [Pseudorhodoplanes sp.]
MTDIFFARDITTEQLAETHCIAKTRAADAIWFAPGQDDIDFSRAPACERDFASIWDLFKNYLPSECPDYAKSRANAQRQLRRRSRKSLQRSHAERLAAGDEEGAAKIRDEIERVQPYIDSANYARNVQLQVDRRRRNEGYIWLGGDFGGLGFVPKFWEFGDRSRVNGAHVLARFEVLIPAAGRGIFIGQGKAGVVKALTKRQALYSAYITTSQKVIGYIRIDIDRTFPSWSFLNSSLIDLYDRGEIPLRPHLGVAKRTEDGKVVHPQLIFLLPYHDQVRRDGRCRPGAMQLLSACENGLIRALEPLGSDPGGRHNKSKVKNPFCPFMIVGIFNQNEFLGLRDIAGGLADCSPLDRGFEQAWNARKHGVEQHESNQVFVVTRRLAWAALGELASLGAPLYAELVDDRGKMAAWVVERFSAYIETLFDQEKAGRIRAIVKAVAAGIARHWKPDQTKTPPNRGAMSDVIDQRWPLSRRQHESAKWTNSKRSGKVEERMLDAMARLADAGRDITPSAVVKAGGGPKSTVHKHFCRVLLIRQRIVSGCDQG